jgi:hypothetical protein
MGGVACVAACCLRLGRLIAMFPKTTVVIMGRGGNRGKVRNAFSIPQKYRMERRETLLLSEIEYCMEGPIETYPEYIGISIIGLDDGTYQWSQTE